MEQRDIDALLDHDATSIDDADRHLDRFLDDRCPRRDCCADPKRDHRNQLEAHGELHPTCTHPLLASNARCSKQNTNSSPPITILVHHELSEPSNAISVWMIPRISTPNSVPA